MFIQTEQTPNPATLKFLPGQTVVESGQMEVLDADEAERVSPLAKRLFEVDGVRSVFMAKDFVAVTKRFDADWYLLKPAVLGAIVEHFMSSDPAVTLSGPDGLEASPDDDEVVTKIKELLESRVRPAVANDGGDIVFHGFERGVVYLHMKGACAGCPSSIVTLKSGIENLLRYYVPDVVEVRAID